jgi:hypothetical protein
MVADIMVMATSDPVLMVIGVRDLVMRVAMPEPPLAAVFMVAVVSTVADAANRAERIYRNPAGSISCQPFCFLAPGLLDRRIS